MKVAVFTLIVICLSGCKTSQIGPTLALTMFDKYVEQVRWARYWDARDEPYKNYTEGKSATLLLFWTSNPHRLKWGFCSVDIAICVANPSIEGGSGYRQLEVASSLSPRQAFGSFAGQNYGDGGASFPSLNEKDFEFEERKIVLPVLGLPASIANSTSPESFTLDAEEIRRSMSCWREGKERPSGCKGTLVLPFYSNADPRLYVLRTCSQDCDQEFRGDAIQSFTSGPGGWYTRGANFSNNPIDVESYKPKIEKSAVLRIEIP